jgi:hypothetical protein
MKRLLAATLSLILLAVVLPSCAAGPVGQSQPGGTGQLRLMVSDGPNDIGDFTSVNATVSKFGILSADTDNWTEITLDNPVTFDLTKLQGDNATSVWDGNIASGNYTKVFIYVDSVTGILGGDNVTVKLPGDKLQISKPFTVAPDSTVSFVFDITIIKAGNSGKYILKPQLAASGADQPIHDVTPNATGNQNRHAGSNESGEKPEGAGKPADATSKGKEK